MLTMDCAHTWLDAKPGKIINILSILALSGGIDTVGYTVAKPGLGGLTKTLANDWSHRGINVNAIAPANRSAYGSYGGHSRQRAALRAVFAACTFKQWGEPADIAGCALYLATPTSNWVHGSIYVVDGGYGNLVMRRMHSCIRPARMYAGLFPSGLEQKEVVFTGG